MDRIPYFKLNNVSFNIRWVIYKCDVILCFSKNEFLGWKNQHFDNHNMALMLIEVLYEKGMINEDTYRAIMRKNQIQHRVA